MGARFLTRDPLEAVTRSAYGYVGNNPLNVTDPTGLAPWDGVVDFFTGGDCGDGLLGAVGGFLSDDAGHIAFGAAALGYFVPGWNVVAIGFGAWSAYGNFRDGNYLLAVIDLASAGSGGASLFFARRSRLLLEAADNALIGYAYLVPLADVRRSCRGSGRQQAGRALVLRLRHLQ